MSCLKLALDGNEEIDGFEHATAPPGCASASGAAHQRSRSPTVVVVVVFIVVVVFTIVVSL